MKKNLVILVCFFAFTSFSVFTKTNFSELVKEKLELYRTSYSPEKIYLHTDKPYYSLDETIWFSGYLIDGITHEKTKKSWVFYVDLIDENDSIVSRKKMFTNNINASGDIKIKKNWKPGKYLLRAYSNYMRNESAEYFYQKEINIWKTTSADSIKSSISNKNEAQQQLIQTKPDLGFYPEGGSLVENIRSTIAIKVKNAPYKNLKISGIIVDNDNHKIAEFNTLKFGLGAFTLKPESNKTYSAVVKINGVEYEYSLPKTLPKGYRLSVINSGDYLVINAKSTAIRGLNSSFLVVHQRGKSIFNKLESTDTDSYSIKLPIADLKDGVTHLTLFDAIGNPVCERLVFINTESNNASVIIEKDKEVLETREKIKLKVNTEDDNGNSLPSILSMSVRDLNAFPYNSKYNNIKTWVLLNSDIRGYIKDAGYFFQKENDFKRRYLLDLVMLTHGWRRFTWTDLLYNEKSKQEFMPEKGLTISGTTKYLKKPYGPISGPVRLTFMGKHISQEPIQKSNNKGEFSFGPFIFFDSIQTLVESRLTDFKSKDKKNRNVLILVNNEESSPKVSRNNVLETNIDSVNQIENFLKVSEYLRQINFEFNQKRQQLDEVTILAQKESEAEKRVEEMNERTDYGFPSSRLDVEKDLIIGGETVYELLFQLPGVRTSNDSIYISGYTGNPTVLLDNFEVDADLLVSLPASDVSFIDVLRGAQTSVYARGGNGVIAIYSKTGNVRLSRNVKRKPGIIDFAAQGFYTAREFYAPDHINGFEELNRADIRTTLHWEPKIKTSDSGYQEIEFFTSDNTGDYIIEIEGITTSGIPLHNTTTFSVE